ncbi:type II secretion system F family protein [Streptomyces sp. NPDC054784]
MNGGGVPSLWTALLAATGCVVTAAGWRRERSARRRARELLGPPSPGGTVASPAPTAAVPRRLRDAPVRQALPALGALLFGVVTVGGPVGWLAGAVGAAGAWRWLRSGGSGADRVSAAEARAVADQLPLAAELLAACLATGSDPGRAAEAVGGALGGPLGDRLLRASTELRLGGEPAAVWGRFGGPPGCEALARCLARAGTVGVPAVEPVTRLAADARARTSRAAAARSRRAAVLVTAPLGLCFLPAFLALGVAPVALGLAGSLL